MMPLHDKAFWSITFFLIGIFAASVLGIEKESFIAIVALVLLVAGSFLFAGRRELALFSCAILLGVFWYAWDDARYGSYKIPFENKQAFTISVQKISANFDRQIVVADLLPPFSGRIQIIAPRYPAWRYGDEIVAEGTINRPSPNIADRLSKDRVAGVSAYPKMELKNHGRGNPIRAALFGIKEFVENSYRRVLAPEKAAFLAGLTLGDTAEFSKEFREKMSVTGTSHLVALSGYNVTVIAKAILAGLGFFLSRRKALVFAGIAVAAFVVMTGAEASVVRAAIMAGIILLAEHSSRLYNARNAIVVAAFIMAAVNPKVLRWDLGFQLSFLALLGLVYLRPALAKLFKWNPEPGFFAWRENFLTTLAAQIAVLPILAASFGLFSPISLVTNVLILGAIPVTMTLGAALVATSVISSFFATIMGAIVNLFLSYEIGIINFFSQIPFVISLSFFGAIFALLYYFILGLFVWKMRSRHPVIAERP